MKIEFIGFQTIPQLDIFPFIRGGPLIQLSDNQLAMKTLRNGTTLITLVPFRQSLRIGDGWIRHQDHAANEPFMLSLNLAVSAFFGVPHSVPKTDWRDELSRQDLRGHLSRFDFGARFAKAAAEDVAQHRRVVFIFAVVGRATGVLENRIPRFRTERD